MSRKAEVGLKVLWSQFATIDSESDLRCHFGTSKWFAFSKMDIGAAEMLRKLEEIL